MPAERCVAHVTASSVRAHRHGRTAARFVWGDCQPGAVVVGHGACRWRSGTLEFCFGCVCACPEGCQRLR